MMTWPEAHTVGAVGHGRKPCGWNPVLLAALALSVVHVSANAGPIHAGIGPLRTLASPAGTASAEPRLSVAPSGRVLLSWLEQRAGGGHRLRMSWLNGERWSVPVAIAEGDSFFANWADFPSVRPLDDQHLIAHWLWKVSGDTYGYHVRTARSLDGGRTWSLATTLHQDTSATEHGFVSLVSTGAHGAGMAVWLDGHNFKGHGEGHGAGPDMAVHGASLGASGFSDEHEIDPRACDCCQTAAVATSRGVLVAYRDRSAEEIRDIALARFEEGRWSAPYPLHADGWHIAGCPVNGPALAASANDVAIAWFTAAGDTARVNVAFSGDGGERFGRPIRVDLGQPSGRVAIALLPDRTALVSWLEGAGEQAAIQMRRVARDESMSQSWVVTRTSGARASGFPQLVTSAGRVLAAWTDPAKPSRIRLAIGAITPGRGAQLAR